jgi:hypothetical protein
MGQTRRLAHRALAVPLLLYATGVLAADKIDPRLATVRKAYIVPIDELGQDRLVVACFPEKLKERVAPIEPVESKESADVVLKIQAHIPSKGARYALGGFGKTPSAHVDAQLPDGTTLWTHDVKTNALASGGVVGASRTEDNYGCALADRLVNGLIDAMRKARDKK